MVYLYEICHNIPIKANLPKGGDAKPRVYGGVYRYDSRVTEIYGHEIFLLAAHKKDQLNGYPVAGFFIPEGGAFNEEKFALYFVKDYLSCGFISFFICLPS